MNVVSIDVAVLADLRTRIERLESIVGSRADDFERAVLASSFPIATVKRVCELVSWHTGIAVRDIVGPARQGMVVRARDAVVYVARQQLGLSHPQIGARLGRDHTTIMAAFTRADVRRDADPAFKLLIERVADEIAAEATTIEQRKRA